MAKTTAAGAATTTAGMQFSRTQMAACLGVSPTTVDAWVRKGCPLVQKGRRGVEAIFNSADVVRWRCDSVLAEATGDGRNESEDLKLRKLQAETELAELTVAKAKGDVVELPMVERALSNAFAEVQARFRNLPSRTVSLLIGETDEQRFKSVLLTEIDSALELLSKLDLTGLPEEGDEEEDDDGGDE